MRAATGHKMNNMVNSLYSALAFVLMREKYGILTSGFDRVDSIGRGQAIPAYSGTKNFLSYLF